MLSLPLRRRGWSAQDPPNLRFQSKAHLDRVLTSTSVDDPRSSPSSRQRLRPVRGTRAWPRVPQPFYSAIPRWVPVRFLRCERALASAQGPAQGSCLEAETDCTLRPSARTRYYLFSQRTRCSRSNPQHGYHESGPFSKWEGRTYRDPAPPGEHGVRRQIRSSEVDSFVSDGRQMIQQEIEFLP